MIQLICSECSSELDVDVVQQGYSIELKVYRCSCQDTIIEDLENEKYSLSRKLEEAKSQLYNIESQVETLTARLMHLE